MVVKNHTIVFYIETSLLEQAMKKLKRKKELPFTTEGQQAKSNEESHTTTIHTAKQPKW